MRLYIDDIKKKLQYALLVILFYIYIFNPVFSFVGFGINNILLLVAGLSLIVYNGILIENIRVYMTELILIVTMIIYLLVTVFLSGTGYYQGALDLLSWLTTLLFLPIFLVYAVLVKHRDIGFYNLIINVGVVAASISVISILIPGLNSFLRGIQLGNELDVMEELGQLSVRGFGLGGNLTSGYGYMMGLLASICTLKLIDSEKRRWYYVVYIILFLIAILVNARTGMFALLITLGIIFLKSLRSFNTRGLIILAAVIGGGILLLALLKKFSPDMYEFVQVFLDFLSSMENYEGSAYDQMLHFPETTHGLIFGEGVNIFLADYMNSDLGYVRNIYLGGIVFLVLLMLEQFVLYRKMYHRSDRDIFVLILFLSVIVFHYKGSLFYTPTAVSRFVMLLYFVLVYNELYSDEKIELYV